MTCRDLTASVVAYLDGDLDDDRASACRGHLRVCAACRDLADQHARLRDALVELPPPEPPPALWAQINARLGAAEIADSERGPVARAWTRLRGWARPVLWPATMIASAGAIALVVGQLRHGGDATRPLALTAPVTELAPPAPPVHLALRDALDEHADLERDAEARFRKVAAELLAMARTEVASWPAARARHFAHEVERRERAVLTSDPGLGRDRAWHELTAYLERVALGEQVAMGGAR
ncbi:MAG: zf-HC2 domain-containing protein [Myxococcales bacterium]|nr:zf-HC2 domain-containing protein [Myxococcales bacterium]